MTEEEKPREHDREHEREHERGRERERESTADDEGLPAHRIALRAGVRGAVAGLCVSIAAIAIFMIGDPRGGGLTRPHEWLMLWIGAATGCGLLVGADEVSRHAPRRLRLPTATLIGALTAAVMTAAVIWVEALLTGKGATGGMQAIATFGQDVLDQPKRVLPGGAGLLIVFLALWRSRTLRTDWKGVLLRSLVGAAAGLASFGLLCVFWGFPSDWRFATVVFMALPAVAVPGLGLGALLEERLLRLIARWRELP